MGERVGPWWMPCPCHADECPPHYSSFHHSVMMHLMIIILKNMTELEIFMMKRYQILIIHPQHQHHRHHQVTNSKTPLATCIVWGTLWYEVHLLMPGSLCQHEDFIHTIGLMVDQLLSIWTLFCCSLLVSSYKSSWTSFSWPSQSALFIQLSPSSTWYFWHHSIKIGASQPADGLVTFFDKFQNQQWPHCHIYASANVSHSLTDCPLVIFQGWIFFRGE